MVNPNETLTLSRPDAVDECAQDGDGYVFAHLSDPHLTSLEGVRHRDLLNKRLFGYLSWLRHRREEHRSEVLSALVRDLGHTRPDHVVVTGDLTHLGLPSEFDEVSEWLCSVGGPADITIIPGNHDTYVKESWERTLARWTPYMRSDRPNSAQDQASNGVFPSLRVRGPLALIGLSSAYPSAPFLATGRLGSEQLAALDRLLAETGQAGLIRIVLIHHPPTEGTVRWRKRLTDAPALCDLFGKRGVELVLHGHAHRSALEHLDTGIGRVPVIGVPSASGIGLKPGRRAQYHLYRVQRQGNGWDLQVCVRGYAPETDRFEAQGEHTLSLPPLNARGGAAAR